MHLLYEVSNSVEFHKSADSHPYIHIHFVYQVHRVLILTRQVSAAEYGEVHHGIYIKV